MTTIDVREENNTVEVLDRQETVITKQNRDTIFNNKDGSKDENEF